VYGPQETFADAAVFGVRDRGCNGRTEQPEESWFNASFSRLSKCGANELAVVVDRRNAPTLRWNRVAELGIAQAAQPERKAGH
jgi:hypothetical protein